MITPVRRFTSSLTSPTAGSADFELNLTDSRASPTLVFDFEVVLTDSKVSATLIFRFLFSFEQLRISPS
ncbi:hypothetical protein MTO96_006368 [Rhipicephalus appendiculatus]